MAIEFPASPTNGDTHTHGATTYAWDATMGVWNITGSAGVTFGSSGGASVTASDSAPSNPSEGDLWFNSTLLETYVYYNSQWVLSNPSGSGGGGASLTTSDTAPSNPSAGDLWFDSTDLTTYVYYDDGSSSQWVSSMPSGVTAGSSGGGGGAGVTTYADITARNAATPSQGDLAYVTSVTALYVYDGTEWDRVWSGADEYPTWTTELPTNTILEKDGTATTLTVLATDPEGFDMTYTHDTSPSSQTQATIVNNNDGTFTLTPSTDFGDAGEFTFRAKATDGVSVIYTTTNTRLAFSEDITFSSSEPGIASDTTNTIAYSKNNSSTDATSGGTRSSVLQDGRYYLEIEQTSTTSNVLIGVARSDEVNIGYQNAGQPTIYQSNGNLYPGATATGLGSIGAGDILQIAYDNTTDEVWFNKNNGTWYPNDPSSGAGVAIGGTSGGTITLILCNGASSGSAMTADIKIASTGFNYTVPTGFSGH